MARYEYKRFAYRKPAEIGGTAERRVVIVGAGPVGLAAAIDLAQRGVATTVLDEPSPVRIRLSDGTVVEADAVVGADGTHSMLARHLNGTLTQHYVRYTAWRGVADYPLDPDLAGETLGPGLEVGHVPMGPDHTYWFTTEMTPEGGSSPGGELAYLRTKFADWAEPVPSILAATTEDEVLRNDLYDRTRARTWRTPSSPPSRF